MPLVLIVMPVVYRTLARAQPKRARPGE
jgi:hypothetical protein